MSGSSRASRRVEAGGPSRVTSRRKPSIAGWRAARRNIARTIASTRPKPSPAPSSAPHEASGHLVGAAIDDRVEQRLLRREPVEDRLLADPEVAGEVVERGAVVAAGAEGVHGGDQDPLVGRFLHPSSSMLVYQMVDKGG